MADVGKSYPDREVPMIWSDAVDGTPEGVAAGLRAIADRIEADGLCLIGIYNCGFGEAWEATLQVTATRMEPVLQEVKGDAEFVPWGAPSDRAPTEEPQASADVTIWPESAPRR